MIRQEESMVLTRKEPGASNWFAPNDWETATRIYLLAAGGKIVAAVPSEEFIRGVRKAQDRVKDKNLSDKPRPAYHLRGTNSLEGAEERGRKYLYLVNEQSDQIRKMM